MTFVVRAAVQVDRTLAATPAAAVVTTLEAVTDRHTVDTRAALVADHACRADTAALTAGIVQATFLGVTVLLAGRARQDGGTAFALAVGATPVTEVVVPATMQVSLTILRIQPTVVAPLDDFACAAAFVGDVTARSGCVLLALTTCIARLPRRAGPAGTTAAVVATHLAVTGRDAAVVADAVRAGHAINAFAAGAAASVVTAVLAIARGDALGDALASGIAGAPVLAAPTVATAAITAALLARAVWLTRPGDTGATLTGFVS